MHARTLTKHLPRCAWTAAKAASASAHSFFFRSCCRSCRAGQLQFCQPASSLPQLAQGQLLEMVTGLLRQEKQAMQAAGIEKPLEYDPAREGEVDAGFSYVWNNGWVPGTLGTSLAHGTNAVMRM